MIVEELKKSILKYAIEGKLTKMLENDSDVNQLSDLYLEELKSTNNYNKINKSLKGVSNIPFELKRNWKWLRLGNIIRIHSGDGLVSKNMVNEGIPVYGGNGITGYHNKYNVEKSTIVIGRVGFYCGSVHLTENKCWVTDNAFIVDYPEKYFDIKYLLYFLKYLNLGKNNSSTAQPVISGAKIYNILCPVAPIEEQQRIVEKIEEIFDEIDNIYSIEEKLNVLNGNFPSDLKKSIIQSAVSGRLTKQNKNESVNLIIEHIENKINKKIISVSNYPFEIPSNWFWIKFGELVDFEIGKTPPRADLSYWSNNEFHWTSISDMIDNGFITDTKEYVSNKAFKEIYKEKISKKGTLIMSFKLTVGRCSILNIDSFHNEGIISIYPNYDSEILKNYLFKILPFITKYGNTKNAIKGNTLNSKSLNDLLIPLPPIEEQKRIVDKLEQLLPLCDDIDKIVSI